MGGTSTATVEAYRRVARAVQSHGTRLFVQLFHGGRGTGVASAPRPVAVSSSALPSHRYHSEPRALRTAEVEETVRAYGRCAALAAEAGLDGIEVTAAHGYLAEQFFNPAWNLRTDRYGEGSIHRPLQRPVRKFRVQLAEIGFLDAAREIGVAVVFLAERLAPGDADLRRIQHHDVVAGIDVRRVFRLVLAAQAHGDLRREAAEHLVLGVDDVPAVNHFLCFCGECLHHLAAGEKARILSKKRRNLLRLRQIHLLEEGGGDKPIMSKFLLHRNINNMI